MGADETEVKDMPEFQVVSEFQPTGDQPEAIAKLAEGVRKGHKHQTLMGVTGSGKTYVMAKIVEAVQKPTLVISHNNTLAAQLYSEFREFFPNNAVEYFVSTTITTSRRLTSRAPTPTSRRTPPSTSRSRNSVFRPPVRCCRAATPSSSPAFPASTASVRRMITSR